MTKHIFATVAALLLGTTLTLSGCGGSSATTSGSNGNGATGSGGTSGSPGGGTTTTNSLTGVAASGDPLAAATVTLKDQNGNTQAATTASDGSFSIDVTGLTAPFLLQVVSADGTTTYYSASASPASSNPTANLNQYTDLAIRAYFAALDASDVSTDFADVSAATVLPAQADLNNLASALNSLLQPTLSIDGVASASSFNIFNTAFTANETGFDALLHDTSYTSAGSPSSPSSYTIITPAANGAVLTESGTVTISAGQITVSNTNTNQTNGATTASSAPFVTVSVTASTAQQQTDEQAALAGIQTLWSDMVATAQAQGTALSASDLAAYFDAGFLQNGENASVFESALAQQLAVYVAAGQASGSIGQIYAFSDAAGNPVTITAQPLLNVSTSGGDAYSVDLGSAPGTSGGQGSVYIQESDGSYRLYGNQLIASTSFHAVTDNICAGQCLAGASAQMVLSASSIAPFAEPYSGTGLGSGTVSSITIANTGSNAALPDCTGSPPYAPTGTAPLSLTEFAPDGNAPVDSFGGQQFEIFMPAACPTGGISVTSFPPAGTQYQVTYYEPSGATQSTTLTMNSQTTETVPVTTQPSGSDPTSLVLTWPLPSTFALRNISISGVIGISVPASYSLLGPTAQSATVEYTPVTGNAGPQGQLTISFEGTEGELVVDIISLYQDQ